MHLWPSILIVAIAASSASADLLRADFKTFFPEYHAAYRRILTNDSLCGEIYQLHQSSADLSELLDEQDDGTSDDPFFVPDLDAMSANFGLEKRSHQLVDCMLDHTPEIVKARMASAQVLLGLVPSLLAFIGPHPLHTGVVAFVGKRYLLAFLLALGAPTLSPALISGDQIRHMVLSRGSERINSAAWLERSIFLTGSRRGETGTGYRGRILAFVGWVIIHIVALVSIGNIAELSYRIGSRTVFTFQLADGWLIFLWAFIGLFMHMVGALSIFLRVKNIRPAAESAGSENPSEERLNGPSRIRIQVLSSTILSAMLAWFTAIATVMHVFFGTLLFSSILFVGVKDAVFIMLRLFGSVVFCRFAAQFVIAIDRRSVDVISEDGDYAFTRGPKKTW
jgi:hypothetical protein